MLDYKIQTFLSLCKNMNYRVTAQELNMTQPAVTNHIHQLESEYACKLFTYKNRVLKMTKQAEILQSYALTADYNAQLLAQELAAKERKILRIGATKTIGEYVLTSDIKRLVLNSDVDLTYIVDNTDNLIKKLCDGKLDFVFIEGYINKARFAHYTFKTEELVGICAHIHPFAGREVELSDIFLSNIILREEGSGTREAFERMLADKNSSVVNFAKKTQTNSFKTITELVGTNAGISFVYASVANSCKNLSQFKIKGVCKSHEFTCLHLKDTPRPDFLDEFIH